jgi:hypothetical protein
MRRDKFYGMLDVRRAMIASAPFWLAAAASNELHAQLTATDLTSLRSHIVTVNASTGDDTININAGTYTLTGGPDGGASNPGSGDLDIFKTGGNLTIQGAGTATTIIDGAALDRVFHIDASTGGTITIRNLTIRNGLAVDDGGLGLNPVEVRGGAIYNQSATNLTLEGVVFESNVGNGPDGLALGVGMQGGYAKGGAVYSAGGTLTITGCRFESNALVGGEGWTGTLSAPSAQGGNAEGAGLYVEAGTVTIASSTFTDNDALAGTGGRGQQSLLGGGPGGTGRGGAIFILAGGLQITASTIDSNVAVGGTGGEGGWGPTGYFSGVFAGNGGSGGLAAGGGVYASAGTVTLQNCTVSGNGATGGDGGNGGNGGDASQPGSGMGGLGGDGGAGANADGAGVFTAGGSLAIQNSTISGNSTAAGAGGAGGLGGSGAGGSFGPGAPGAAGSDSGGGIGGSGTVTLASTIVANNNATALPDVGSVATASASLVEDDTGATITGSYITGDPALGPLANNGGPTFTHAITNTSIAFNAGANPASLATDQRGTGFFRVRDGTADIGAFELQVGSGGGGGPGGGGTGGGDGGGNGGGCSTDGSRAPWALLLAGGAAVALWFRRLGSRVRVRD